jgi:alpha-aminoadipic semialdehyde synthase
MTTQPSPAPTLGIRLEDKNRWERRAPLTPAAVRQLTQDGLRVVVQPSPQRVFPDDAYARAGAALAPDVFGADVVLAVKEVPKELLRPGGTYLFFSHTIKGQWYNRPLLKRLVELGCSLVDYECITDEAGRRLVFFGRQAGQAGLIDTLWTLGQRLAALGRPSPFATLRPAHTYKSLAAAEAAVAAVGETIRREGVGAGLAPLVCGFAGYGNVSQGAQEVYARLPVEDVAPEDLPALTARRPAPADHVFRVVFREEHLVEAVDPARRAGAFDLSDYFERPAGYRSIFERHAPHLTILLNGIYWTESYPRLLTRDLLRRMFGGPHAPKLLVVGDVSCDIRGSVEATVKATEPDEPVFVYDPETDTARDGFEGPGLAVMAVDNLPCELPRDASEFFSDALLPFVPAIVRADWSRDLDHLDLPAAVRRALVLHRGRFTPEYAYMMDFVE